MGWTGFYPKPGFDEKSYLASLYENEDQTLIALSRGKGGYYGALRRTNPGKNFTDTYVPDADGSVTLAIVVLTRRDGGEFLYKDMSETAGPNYYDCPPGVLKRLSRLRPSGSTSYYSAETWRETCRRVARRRKAASRIEEGDTVSFPYDLHFSTRTVPAHTPITVGARQRRTQLFMVPDVGRARIRHWNDGIILPDRLLDAAGPKTSPLLQYDDLLTFRDPETDPAAAAKVAISEALQSGIGAELVAGYHHAPATEGALEHVFVLWFRDGQFGTHLASRQASGSWGLSLGRYSLSLIDALDDIDCRAPSPEIRKAHAAEWRALRQAA